MIVTFVSRARAKLAHLEEVGRDLARLMRTIGNRAGSVVHAEPAETGQEHSSGSHQQTV